MSPGTPTARQQRAACAAAAAGAVAVAACVAARRCSSGFARRSSAANGGGGSGGGPLIVGIVGVSCSGKSTVASRLSEALNGEGAPPALCQDNYFDYDAYGTDDCPLESVQSGPSRMERRSMGRVAPETRVWKDWESPRGIRWAEFGVAIDNAVSAAERQGLPFVVVEGFLLLADPDLASRFDALVAIEVGEAVAWQRRRSRAAAMQGLPVGPGANTNCTRRPPCCAVWVANRTVLTQCRCTRGRRGPAGVRSLRRRPAPLPVSRHGAPRRRRGADPGVVAAVFRGGRRACGAGAAPTARRNRAAGRGRVPDSPGGRRKSRWGRGVGRRTSA
jgi:hypothetical protein